MTTPNDPLYYAARAEVARKLANKARDRGIRQMHEQMARKYESLAFDLGTAEIALLGHQLGFQGFDFADEHPAWQREPDLASDAARREVVMDQQRCVFVVESDPEMAATLARYLRAERFIPCIFSDGRIAAAAVRNGTPAAVILDIGLSGIRGVTICDAVRQFSSVPILRLTECIEEVDILRGIDCGFDAYVCKPFSAREVIARLRAIILAATVRTHRRSEPVEQLRLQARASTTRDDRTIAA